MAKFNQIINTIRAIVKNEQIHIDISEILYKHKCFYLLSMLKKATSDISINKVIISERYKTCMPVFEAIKELPYAVIKGAVLSQAAYGDISYRKSGDIDLIVNRTIINKLINIMLNNGFIQGKISDNGIIPFTRQEILFHSLLTHQTAPFVKKTDNVSCPYVEVDINMDVLWGENTTKVNMNYILSTTVASNICGVMVYKLNTVMEFISLCLHHYKDMNSIYLLSYRRLKLYLFCDIYFYLINNNVDIMELVKECNILNVAEYIYYCIYYTNIIFFDMRLKEYLSALENEECKNILNTFGLDNNERKFWNISFFDRLFSDHFFESFNELLDEKDRNKIRKNNEFM